MKRPSSIRAKVSLASTVISAIAMLAIVLSAAFITQSVLTRSILTTLDSHLNALQIDLESGVNNLSIEGTGAELIQVIDADGNVIASSDWAWGVAAVAEGGLAPGDERRIQHEQLQLTRNANRTDEESPTDSGTDFENDSGASSFPQNASGVNQSNKYTSSTNVYDAVHDEDEEDDDEDEEEDDSDDEDSDDGEDGVDESFDESDDSDSRGASRDAGNASKAPESSLPSATFSLASPFTPVLAYADVPVEGQTVSASSLLGTDGPFVVIERGVSTPHDLVTIAAVVSIAPAIEASYAIMLVLSAISVLTVACVAIFSWVMASRTLRPVIDMRGQVEDITASDLSLRIPVPQSDPDLAKLASTFNDMIGRVEAAMVEQRRFISDASHELKSPVAATRIMLEAARSHPEAVDEETLLRDLTYENERMGGIVGNLLLLAQHDENGLCVERHPIDLCDLMFEEASALRARTSLNVDTSGIQPIVCIADGMMIRRAVRNLLDNAARYAKSTVKVSCAEDGGYVRIVVSDDGPGIPDADRERVFGRFVRLEEGRSRKQGSTGLGLAVVKTIAEDHGGTAYFADLECGGATVVVEIDG